MSRSRQLAIKKCFEMIEEIEKAMNKELQNFKEIYMRYEKVNIY